LICGSCSKFSPPLEEGLGVGVLAYEVSNPSQPFPKGKGYNASASAQANPLAQAHWKLYPPSQPVTSTASPMA